METVTLSKSWLFGSFHVSKFHCETYPRPYFPVKCKRALVIDNQVKKTKSVKYFPLSGKQKCGIWLTNVSHSCMIDQVTPFHHLLFVLKVMKEVWHTSHQLKSCSKNADCYVRTNNLFKLKKKHFIVTQPGLRPFCHSWSISVSRFVKLYLVSPLTTL